jgi:hypothetical protein
MFWKTFNVLGFLGALTVAVKIQVEPTPFFLWCATILIVVSALAILARDIREWRR